MSASLLLSWREGVTASADGEGTLVVQGPGARVSLRQVPVAILEALRRLDPPGLDQDRLCELIQGNGDGALARWYYYLERLTRRGLLCHAAQAGGTRLATLVAVSPSFVSGPARVVAGRRYVLSRFAYLRREGTEAVLESPLAHARIILNDCRAAALVGALAAPATAAELAERVGGLGVDAVAGVLALLLRAGMLGGGGCRGPGPGPAVVGVSRLAVPRPHPPGAIRCPVRRHVPPGRPVGPAARPETGHGGAGPRVVSPRPGSSGARRPAPGPGPGAAALDPRVRCDAPDHRPATGRVPVPGRPRDRLPRGGSRDASRPGAAWTSPRARTRRGAASTSWSCMPPSRPATTWPPGSTIMTRRGTG